MQYSRCAAGFALAILAILGLVGPLAAGVQVPFKGNLVGTDLGVPVVPPTVPPTVAVTVKATGNATHLGKFTFTELATVNTATLTGSGTFLFTAANGDTVFGTITGKATPAPPLLAIAETAIITGGTGRFAGATGGFTVTRVKNTVTFVTTATFTGTISSPGANKQNK